MEEELVSLVQWYQSLPEDFRRYVAFRHERVKDPGFADLYEVLKLAERAAKLLKKGKS